MKKNLLYVPAALFYLASRWVKDRLIEVTVAVVLLAAIGFGIAHYRASTISPITTRNDCGLILDVDDVGPDSRQSKIRTDKMIALTDLRFSASIPNGSRLYYIERESGWKGWMIAP